MFAVPSLRAQGETSLYNEQHRKVRGSSSVDVVGPNPFGDQISIYSGRVEFVQQDFELPGNSALFVGIGRRLTSGRDMVNDAGMFGDWDIELPRLHGIFAAGARNKGWAVGDYPPDHFKRCSQFAAPPIGFAMGGNGYVWEPEEYWFGNTLYAPGQGSQPILVRSPANTVQPTVGSYPLITKSGWQLQCLPSIANSQGFGNVQGEAFSALAPDGTRWRFDHLVERRTTTLTKTQASGGSGALRSSGTPSPRAGLGRQAPSAADASRAVGDPHATVGYRLERAEVWLLPTQATDRFGNTVTYTYDSGNPWKLLSIQSSDGRVIVFTHDGTSARIKTVNDGTRVWSYEYSGSSLTRIVRPDGSTWQFSNTYAFKNMGPSYTVNPNCDDVGQLSHNPQTITMNHPSGAVGQFTVQSVVHGRSNVPRTCSGGVRAVIPHNFADRSLVSKVISGPGLATAAWTYDYGVAAPSWAPCGTGCTPTKTVTVTAPGGVVTRSTFGTRYATDEGRLLTQETIAESGTVLRTTAFRYGSPTAGPYPDPVGYNPNLVMDNDQSTRHHPADQRVITQQGSSFVWQANTFDVHARPLQMTRTSSLGYGRTETATYYDNTSLWVLGQVGSVTVGPGIVTERHDYDPATALRIKTYAFDALTQQNSYHPDGTLYTTADAVNPPTVLTNYWRGVPRAVAHPDGSNESAEVNNLGQLTSHTNAAGTTTHYGYDAMGRPASIQYPAESSGAYHPTLISFEQVRHPEYGIPGDHWRHTTSTGNAITVRYLDALWRVGLTRTYDAADEARTSRFVETRYNLEGHKIFESQQQRSMASIGAAVPGTTWWYDALERPVVQRQDSELGPLHTFTEYLNGFQRRHTNPRGYASITAFQAFDQPSEETISSIAAPEGVNLAIDRDLFGKPTAITRSGGDKSVTRIYVYDHYQRLCKTIEPESGATVQKFDAAGNLTWRGSGLPLPGPHCDQESVPDSRKVAHTYDQRNRLLDTTFGDGSQWISRAYTADGRLHRIRSGHSDWIYQYNNRRDLVHEHDGMWG